eukprot:TRINITY_DN7489_c0_g1_i1.p1 TRINITY_DN7489_c0_g1~~TRINITY_DN7489_c0_g1_i1.p1  ORF type:complete len:503 (-),score=91.86 TRINITY_DN7489_c0_g1_i1:1228-2736(-)
MSILFSRWSFIVLLFICLLTVLSFLTIHKGSLLQIDEPTRIFQEASLVRLQKRVNFFQEHLAHLELDIMTQKDHIKKWKDDQTRITTRLLRAAENREKNLTVNENNFLSSIRKGDNSTDEINQYDLSWYQKNIRANVTRSVREEAAWASAIRLLSSCEAHLSNPIYHPSECSLLMTPHSRRNSTNKMDNDVKNNNNDKNDQSQFAKDPLLFLLHIQKAGGSTLEYIAERETVATNLRWKENRVPVAIGWKRGRDLSPTSRRNLAIHWQKFETITGHYGFGIHEVLWETETFAKERNFVYNPTDNTQRISQSEVPPSGRRGYIYATMFRNPIDRLVSLYRFWKRPAFNFTRERLGRSLEEFLENSSISQALPELKDNHQVRVLCGYSVFMKPRGELRADDLVCAMMNLRDLVAIPLVMEQFEEGLYVIEKRLGWKIGDYYSSDNPLVINSSGNQTGSTASLSKRAMNAITELTKYDVILYRYAQCKFKRLLTACQKSSPANPS